MAELSYLFIDCDNGNEHHCNVLGIDVSFLHRDYVYTSQEYGCVTFQKKSEEPPTETITITDGVFVDCNSCAAKKHFQAYHFRKGCSAQEYEDIFVIDTGKLKPKEYAYYQDLYNGCWQYIGYDDVGIIGINGQLLDYMEFNQTPYDNCHCSQMYEAYLFKDCDGNELYFKVKGTFDIGKHYINKNTGVCCEFIGKTQTTFEPTTVFINGDECDCYKYMIFSTCDGKHKFYTSLDSIAYLPDLQCGDVIHLMDNPCGESEAWIYANYPNADINCYNERIKMLLYTNINFELYVNCFKFEKLGDNHDGCEQYPWTVYRVEKQCKTSCCEIFFDCKCRLCGSEEQVELYLSNVIINTINNTDYNIFVTKDGKYVIDDVGYASIKYCGSEADGYRLIYSKDIIKYLKSCEEEENCELTIKPKHGDVEYYERVNCEFASAVFNEAMAERYGVEFCCKKDLQRLTIKKKLLDAGALQDDVDLCKCEI